MNVLTVSAVCPQCGAPLDFTHGSNAVKCCHCNSNLLVTGRKQLLSYYVPAKLKERKAVALAMKSQRDVGREGFSDVKAGLYFLPYYRMTGHDFGLVKAPPKPLEENESSAAEEEHSGLLTLPGESTSSWGADDSGNLFDAVRELFNLAVDQIIDRHAGKDEILPGHQATDNSRAETGEPINAGNHRAEKNDTKPYRGSLYENGDLVLVDRYIEKNFVACNLRGRAFYSLGVRPSVLRLELFRKPAIESFGRSVSPGTDPVAAESIGLKNATGNQSLYRKVVGKKLSLIYFPFWVISINSQEGAAVTVIDAVSESVVMNNAGISIYEILDHPSIDEFKVTEFRPLTCPNCGWDLPLRPEDTVFCCSSCGKAWQIIGSELSELVCTVASVPGFDLRESRYLPFWIVRSSLPVELPLNFFIPAFRCRRLKIILDIALVMSRLQPSFSVAGNDSLELSGCHYDSEDAASLAQFTQEVMTSRSIGEFKKAGVDDSNLSSATLTWFPFKIEGQYLICPFGGIRIPVSLIL